MRTRELRDLFKEHKNEYLKFKRVTNPRSKRPDLHAFLLLDYLCPGDRDMISCAWHDNIGLDIDLSDLAKVITEEQVIELIQCGVRINENGCLVMFA